MLSIVVMGGLGNQLFQIFTAIAYSIRNKIQVVLPDYKPIAMKDLRIGTVF